MQAVLDNIHDMNAFTWSVLEEVHGERWQLFARESWWIKHLKTVTHGYNSIGGAWLPDALDHAQPPDTPDFAQLPDTPDFAQLQHTCYHRLAKAMGLKLEVGEVAEARSLDSNIVEPAAIACFDARRSPYRDYKRREGRKCMKKQSVGRCAVQAANRVLTRWYSLKLVRVGNKRSTQYRVCEHQSSLKDEGF